LTHPFDDTMRSLCRTPPNVWLAHLVRRENHRRLFCEDSHLALEKLCQTRLSDAGELNFLEKYFVFSRSKSLLHLDFLSNLRPSDHCPTKFSFVEGCWRCSFYCCIKSTCRDSQEEWLSMKIRISKCLLLHHVGLAHSPSIFTGTHPNASTGLSRLQAMAKDSVERFQE